MLGPAQELRVVRNVVCRAEPLLGTWSIRDPGFMNPTATIFPEYLGDCLVYMVHHLSDEGSMALDSWCNEIGTTSVWVLDPRTSLDISMIYPTLTTTGVV